MNRKLVQLTVIGVAAVLVLPLFFSGVARADGGGDRDTYVNGPGQGGYFSVDSQSINTMGPKNEYNMVFAGNTFLMQFKNDSQQAGYNLQFNIQLQKLTLVSGNTSQLLLNFSQQEFAVSELPTTVNGLKSFTLYTSSDNASFGMMIQVANAPTTTGGNASAQLTPNEVKLSFMIDLMGGSESGNRNQMMNQQGGSVLLQLGLRGDGSTVSPIDNRGAYSQVNFSQSGSIGYFSWNNSALVNGSASAVTSRLSTANDTLTMIYPAGMTIVHDPYIGISLSPIVSAITSAVGNIVIYAVTLAVSAALIGGAMTMRRRSG